MPYDIKRVNGGWKVFNRNTGKAMSKDPMPLAQAQKQIAALNASDHMRNEKKG